MQTSHLWSLSVEEHFYLLFPFLILLAGSTSTRLKIVLGVIVGCLLVRLVYLNTIPGITRLEIIQKDSETRFDSIAYGCMLALLCESEKGRAFLQSLCRPAMFWLAAAGLFVSSYYYGNDGPYRLSFRYTFQGIALFVLFAGILFSPGQGWLKRLLNNPAAVWIGVISYSLYLWHGLVRATVDQLLSFDPIVMLVLKVVLSLAVASASYYLIEQPFRGLRHRFTMLRPA